MQVELYTAHHDEARSFEDTVDAGKQLSVEVNIVL